MQIIKMNTNHTNYEKEVETSLKNKRKIKIRI
jgi:hypothetical protein